MKTEHNDAELHEWGFALSGGAARCFAHLGAISAFRESGIEPEIISGTSAGALAGALIADGYAPEEILEFFAKLTFLDFTDLTIPTSGLSKPTKVEALLKKYLRAHTFEELQIPLWVTASDFDRGFPVHFSKGPLLMPLVASCCVPIVFTPTAINGILYVDGGLFQNMPASPIRGACRKLVGIDVNPITPKPDIHSLKSTAERIFSLIIASTTRPDRELCDLVISPEELTGYSMLDVDRSREIFDIGYRTARKALMQTEMPEGWGRG